MRPRAMNAINEMKGTKGEEDGGLRHGYTRQPPAT
jgi:hypothetical protein